MTNVLQCVRYKKNQARTHVLKKGRRLQQKYFSFLLLSVNTLLVVDVGGEVA